MNSRITKLLAIVLSLAALVGIYLAPPIHDRISIKMQEIAGQVKYALQPPAQAVFVPTQQGKPAAATPIAAVTPTVRATATAIQTPTPSPVPLPALVDLAGVKYVDQRNRWNYCGIANLTMALNFWGWPGNRDDVAKIIKPGENDPRKGFIERGFTDKNVMPYELVNFTNDKTDLRALYRYGGTLALVKRLVSGGFPVLVEKGIHETDSSGRTGWMGHYLFVTGYDDPGGMFITQDSYLKGPNYRVPYDQFAAEWIAFNRIFLVVYPQEKETQVMDLLGDYADPAWAAQTALAMTDKDIAGAKDVDLFFAWFARGTSQVALQQYPEAGSSYDKAFEIYSTLSADPAVRPWRMMWYQTGPYFAYFYSVRYTDVVNLADFALDKTSGQPTLEESLYWRGMAEYALGQTTRAIDDVRRSVYYNRNFAPGTAKLQEWGVH